MIEAERCPQCGGRLTAGSVEGLCPRCLLTLALRPPAETTPENLPEPGSQIGSYRIVRLLGEGGMGLVYLAEQEEPIARQVALKIIKLGMDTRAVLGRFQSEQQALALMDHPNIAQVYEAGSNAQGRPYFVMEYVPGIPITQYCDLHRLGTRQRLELFLQVVNGVQHAHQKGVIHRDLKPSNVLVMERDGEAVPKIIDFGLAKATEKTLTEESVFTEAGVLIGTPEYMSPEQASLGNVSVDTRTDVYSLGVLLYELLVGAAPFESKLLRSAGYDEIRRIIREDDPPTPAARLLTLGAQAAEIARCRATEAGVLRKQVRGELDWITMKALEKDCARRYPSASEMAADVQHYLRDEPVTAGPAGPAYRLRKFVRKNRLAVGAAFALAVCLIAGLAASTALYVRAERQRVRADQVTAVAERQRIRAEGEAARAERQRELAETATASAGRAAATAERLRMLAEDVAEKASQQRQRAEAETARAEREAYASKLAAAELLRRDGQEQEAKILLADAQVKQARARTQSKLDISPLPGESSAVEGRTVNDVTGEPAPGASVTFQAWGGGGRGGGIGYFTTTSDAAGEFAVRGLPPAAYRVLSDRPGFMGLVYGATEYGQSGQLVTLKPRQRLTGLELRLRPQGVIAGRVIDAYGLPVYNALAAAKFVRTEMGRRVLGTAASAITNDLGEFRIFNVSPGRYWVSATPRPSMLLSLNQGALANPQPEETYGTTYYPGATEPRSGIRVDVAGSVRAGINITLAKSTVVRVSGRVLDATGAVVPAAHVSLQEIGDLAAEPSRSTVTTGTGQFEFRSVSSGSYALIAAIKAPQQPAQGSAVIDVASENLDDIAVTVRPQFDLPVSLTIDGGGRADALLEYLGLTPVLPVDTRGQTAGPPPKPQGTFTMTGLLPDRYRLIARPRTGLYIKSIRLGAADVMGRPFDLTGVDSGTLQITVSANAGVLSGVVSGDSGAPLPQARVLLVQDSVLRAGASNFYDGSMSSLTDQNGGYSLTTVAPGNYRIFAWADPSSQDWSDWEALKAVEDRGRPVEVKEGSRITLDLRAIPRNWRPQ